MEPLPNMIQPQVQPQPITYQVPMKNPTGPGKKIYNMTDIQFITLLYNRAKYGVEYFQ